MADYTGTHVYGIISSYAPSSEELTKALEQTNNVYKNVYSPGTGDRQCDSFFSDSDSSGSLISYDLDNLTDRFGTTLTLSRVKALAIINRSSTSGQTVTIAGDFMTTIFGASFSFALGAGGIFVVEDPILGMAVTADTGDVITLTASTTFETQIFIAGLD